MAFEVFLVNFAADSTTPAARKERLKQLRDVAIATASPDDPFLEITQLEDNSFRIELREGEATAGSDHVAFRLSELRSETLALIHRLAKAADFVIINEGGGPHIILVEPSQQDRLPPHMQDENPILCDSPQRLETVFADTIESYRGKGLSQTGFRHQWTRQHVDRSIGHGDPEPNVPGLRESDEERYLYIQAKPKEGADAHFKRLGKLLRARKRAGKPIPGGGGMRGTSWQIRIPTGEIFNCFNLTGYHWRPNVQRFIGSNMDTWLNVLLEISRADGRVTAEIINGTYFVCDDGRRFSLDDCESRRTTDEDS